MRYVARAFVALVISAILVCLIDEVFALSKDAAVIIGLMIGIAAVWFVYVLDVAR